VRHPDLDKPLTQSQCALRDDLEATQELPADLAHRFSHQRIFLPREAQTEIAEDLQSGDASPGKWALEMPADSSTGLPGRTAERLDPAAIPEELTGRRHLDAYRPPWSTHVVQPKISGPPDAPQPFLRTLSGRRLRTAYGVYGNDDRMTFRPSGYPWQCIGRVFAWTNGGTPGWSWYGSGVLVGPRHVLTAGHVAPWGSPNWGMLFVPGYYDGVSVVGSGASSWVSDFRSLDSGASTVSAHDMSILRLYDPLGDGLGYFGVKTYDRAWQDGNYWALAGYPSALTPERPSYQLGIAVLDSDADGGALELEHHGDVTSGDSGGPFFGTWPDGFPYVIGTVSGGESISGGGQDEDNNICAGGQDLTDLINYWRTNWT
jgi:V8-like Glu-specific endopeptidase